MDTKVNLIDSPGYVDLTGGGVAGGGGAEGAVVGLAGAGGVEVGTEKVWDYCEERRLPRILFVSMMDKEHADFEKVFNQVKQRLTAKVIPVEIPVGEGPEFHGIINLFSRKCHLYKKGTKAGEYDEVDVPAEYQTRFDKYSQELIESIAASDDTLLERYLGGEEIGREEAIAAMKKGMAAGEIFPLFCGAAELTYGTRALLSKVVELLPSPADRPSLEAQKWGSAERLTLSPADAGPLAAQGFKTISEPHVGDVTYFRVFSGTVRNGQDVWNAPREAVEKLNHLSVAVGKARTEIARGRAEGPGKPKTQTGGRGQYGECWIRLAPLPRGSGFGFEDKIVGGVIPRQCIPAVERGIVEAAHRGPVAGYPVVDFKVELYDGSYHDVDSNEQSFKMAGILAFRNVTPNARPALLEPILEL